MTDDVLEIAQFRLDGEHIPRTALPDAILARPEAGRRGRGRGAHAGVFSLSDAGSA